MIRPALSVVVPLYNESECVAPLVNAVHRALADEREWELVLVDDGSSDDTARIAARIATNDERVRLVRLARNYGQTQAMQAGFDHARGDVVVSMDGDLQNDPEDIPRLLEKLDEGYDLVAGYRVRRQDRFVTRKVPSFVANRLIAWLTGVRVRDNGCSLKAYRRSMLEQLHLYSDMHRFIPALAAATAQASIVEVPVRHHPRTHGTSKYGLSRILKILADLLTIKMIASFRERPLLMFGLGALAAALLGGCFAASWLVIFATSTTPLQYDIAEAYVLPACSILWAALACYLLLLGLVGEEALQNSREAGYEDIGALAAGGIE